MSNTYYQWKQLYGRGNRVSEEEFWTRILLEKTEDGMYVNGPRQEEAVNILNRLRGLSKTIDLKEGVDFEIIQPKQIEYK